MATLTIITVAGVTVTDMTGGAPRNGPPVVNALNGDAFSWEVPNNLKLTFDFSNTATLTFADDDGILSDDPYNNADVVDQRLTQGITIGGRTWAPSASTIRWQYPPPVTVEDEYHVILFDALGNAYQMVGVSITTGYETQVVGIAFLGAVPPVGTALYYIQGQSSYNGATFSPLADLSVEPSAAPCFLRGTLIETPHGPRPVEVLAPGDRVMTLDHGPQPIRWTGSSRVAGTGRLAPVRIVAGHMGNARDLWLSPNHRVLIRGPMAELLFGEAEVLVAVRHLADGRRVRVEPRAEVEYFHILLDDHEILLAEGAPVESLYLGRQALVALDAEARAEVDAVFPDSPWTQGLIRPEIGAREGRLLRAA